MKNIFMVLVIALCGNTGLMAQSIAANKVPAQVTAAFSAKFPKATAPKWEMEKADYEANFQDGGQKHSALFDKTGKWLETETAIKVVELPEAVAKSIATSYAAYTIKEAEKVDLLDKGLVYEVEMKKGTETMEVQFSTDGKVLHSQKE